MEYSKLVEAAKRIGIPVEWLGNPAIQTIVEECVRDLAEMDQNALHPPISQTGRYFCQNRCSFPGCMYEAVECQSAIIPQHAGYKRMCIVHQGR